MTTKVFLIQDTPVGAEPVYYVASGLFERPADWYAPRDQSFIDGPLPLDWATMIGEQVATERGLDFLPRA